MLYKWDFFFDMDQLEIVYSSIRSLVSENYSNDIESLNGSDHYALKPNFKP